MTFIAHFGAIHLLSVAAHISTSLGNTSCRWYNCSRSFDGPFTRLGSYICTYYGCAVGMVFGLFLPG